MADETSTPRTYKVLGREGDLFAYEESGTPGRIAVKHKGTRRRLRSFDSLDDAMAYALELNHPEIRPFFDRAVEGSSRDPAFAPAWQDLSERLRARAPGRTQRYLAVRTAREAAKAPPLHARPAREAPTVAILPSLARPPALSVTEPRVPSDIATQAVTRPLPAVPTSSAPPDHRLRSHAREMLLGAGAWPRAMLAKDIVKALANDELPAAVVDAIRQLAGSAPEAGKLGRELRWVAQQPPLRGKQLVATKDRDHFNWWRVIEVA
jgi:hypothetical protein